MAAFIFAPRGGLDAVLARHLYVEHGDVRPVLQGMPDDFVAPVHLVHDLYVALQREQRRQRTADQVLVLGDEDPNHRGTDTRRRNPPVARGPNSTSPCRPATRSRRPVSPFPG